MSAIDHVLLQLLLGIFSPAQLNGWLGDPRSVAILLGALIAICGALIGTFLMLRKLSLTTDAISHTVLLGIVVSFLVVALLGGTPSLSSPLLIIGAAGAGVLTVLLTEFIYKSGLVRQDAALGLAFPFLFALAVILVSRFTQNVHLDADSVMVGEIGMAWANTESHCYADCEAVIITPEDPRAEFKRECLNCTTLNISPRDPRAEFSQVCANCGTYSPAQAYQAGYREQAPTLVYMPRALSVMLVLTLVVAGFVLVFYKELMLSTFDSALAEALGFRPQALNIGLMVLVSLVCVGAFDAVGSILVIAFFIIPPASAYLLTDRLPLMLVIAPVLGVLGAILGYDLAAGHLLGIELSQLLVWLDSTVGLAGYTTWNLSISASMVLMLFGLFVLTWTFSPRYGLIATLITRQNARRRFAHQVVLAHVYNHQDTPAAAIELAPETLHEHFHWTPRQMRWVLTQLRALNWLDIQAGCICLTERGREQVLDFRAEVLSATSSPESRV